MKSLADQVTRTALSLLDPTTLLGCVGTVPIGDSEFVTAPAPSPEAFVATTVASKRSLASKPEKVQEKSSSGLTMQVPTTWSGVALERLRSSTR